MSILKNRVKTLLTSLQKDKPEADDERRDVESEMEGSSDVPTYVRPLEDEGRTDETIQTIPNEYYQEINPVTSQYELQLLGDGDIKMESLMERILVLKGQDSAVYRKIYDSVFKNYTLYVQELENVTAMELSLTEATRTCVNARRLLSDAERGVSAGGLGLLVKHKRRQKLKLLLDVLRKFRTLQKARDRLNELLEEGDFPSATQLCIECQEAIETYKQFTCVSQLSVSLADVHTIIEDELERALYQIAESFDSKRYELVYNAYKILGKTERAIDLLLMKFTSVVHNKTFSIIASAVSHSGTVGVNPKTQYSVLCRQVGPDHFIDCLTDLCKEMWRIMCSYHNLCQWHVGYDMAQATPTSTERNGSEEREIKFNRGYVKQKLDSGLAKLWMAMQQRIRPYLEACSMSQFQYDNFIKVLNIVNRLITLGVQFCGVGSDQLKQSMRQQSLSYFQHYHKARLEELRLFLENEQWVLCPLRSSFTVTSLREFKFMRSGQATPSSPLKTHTLGGGVFTRYTGNETPFDDTNNEEEEVEDVVVQDPSGMDANSDDDEKDDEDVPAELRKSYVEEDTAGRETNRRRGKSRNHSNARGLVLANVTLTVIRFTGNYMQMMSVLEPIAYDALEFLTHLFDYYLFAVHSFFVSDLIKGDDSSTGVVLSTKLIRSIQRIGETIIHNDVTGPAPGNSFKVPPPVTNPFLQLNNAASLYGISFRIVALESLVFLAHQFELLKPQLESLIPENKRNFLTQFYSQTVSQCHDLKKPVYSTLGAKGIPFDQILPLMSNVKWDIKEIMSQHSRYVDTLLQEFERFNDMLSFVDKQVPIPKDSLDILWGQALKSAAETFVEGFSQAKKCSNEGRALMQLDYQQFRTKMEKMTLRRPLPHHDIVENYIRAYYMSESDLESWLTNNHVYSAKQLQGIVQCGAGGHLNKKTKQRLMSVIANDSGQ